MLMSNKKKNVYRKLFYYYGLFCLQEIDGLVIFNIKRSRIVLAGRIAEKAGEVHFCLYALSEKLSRNLISHLSNILQTLKPKKVIFQ